MEYQFNLGSAVQPQPFIPRNDPAAPMFASVDGVASLLSDEELVFQVRGSNHSQVMTHEMLQCMAACREFRSMDEHIARVLRQVPGLKDAAQARQGLEALARSGLLRSDAQFMEEVSAAPAVSAAAPAAPPMVCVRACDRPAMLGRLLDSMTSSEERFHAGRPLLVVDDSRDDEHARANQSLMRKYAAATGIHADFVGVAQRRKLLKAVTKTLPEAAAAATDLLGVRSDGKVFAGGSGWNAATLLTAGRHLLMLDEDFVLPLRRNPGWKPGLDLRSGELRHTRFFPSLDESLAAGSELEADALAQHLACLGKAPGALDASAGLALGRGDLRGQEWIRLQRLLRSTRVLATQNGTRGALRSASAEWLYQLDADSRAQFWAGRDAYLHNLEGQTVWSGVARAQPVEQGYFTPFALDNSVLLPCASPTGRDEDAVFGTLLQLCHPHSVQLRLPLCIGHVQERARKRSDSTMRATRPGFNSFAYATLLNRLGNVHAQQPAQRLAMAADILDDLAFAPVAQRVSLIREYLNYQRSDLIEQMQRQLAEASDAPIYWRTDVNAIITANGRALLTPGAPVLGGWSDEADEAACARMLGEQLQSLARGLRAWPAMWDWAHERGERLLASL